MLPFAIRSLRRARRCHALLIATLLAAVGSGANARAPVMPPIDIEMRTDTRALSARPAAEYLRLDCDALVRLLEAAVLTKTHFKDNPERFGRADLQRATLWRDKVARAMAIKNCP